MEGTCQWILEDKVFQSWMDEDNSEHPLIWICDKSGMGKTPLAVFISEHLEKTKLPKDGNWIMYYFCDRRQHYRNTAASILRGFIVQVHKKQRELTTIFRKELRIQQSLLLAIPPLWKILRDMMNASPARRIYWIIDGLDQCDEEAVDHFLLRLTTDFGLDSQQRDSKIEETMTTEAGNPSAPTNVPSRSPEVRIVILRVTRSNASQRS